MGLKLHMSEPTRVVYHDAPSLVLVLALLLPLGVEQSPQRVAVKMVQQGLWSGLTLLLGILAGGADESLGEVGIQRLQAPRLLKRAKDTLAEHSLDAA